MNKDMTIYKGTIKMNSTRLERYSLEAARKDTNMLHEKNNLKQGHKAWYLKPAAILLGASLCLMQYCRCKEKASKLTDHTHIHVEINNVFYIKNCGGREDKNSTAAPVSENHNPHVSIDLHFNKPSPLAPSVQGQHRPSRPRRAYTPKSSPALVEQQPGETRGDGPRFSPAHTVDRQTTAAEAEAGFVGALIPAGAHHVRFVYEPLLTRWIPVTLAGLAFTLGLLVLGGLQKRRRAPAAPSSVLP